MKEGCTKTVCLAKREVEEIENAKVRERLRGDYL